ncbi:MAG TPA: ABC transporter ATP-binding protein [Candidatus Binatia bacterium]|nr:ABC transporter ATP-binding protein [Candidatus Binatia bacterium]
MSKSLALQTASVYWHHVWRYPKYVTALLISIPLTVLVQSFLPPLILANVLNRLSKGDFKPHQVWASFGSDLVTYAVLLILGGVVMWRIVDYFVWKLEANIERDLARRVYKHLISQSANFHANKFGGSLVSQTGKLLSGYTRIADTTMFQVMPLLAGLVFTAVILFSRAPLFVVLFMIFSIAFLIIAVKVTKPVRKLSSRLAESESVITGYLADSVTNVMAIKSFAGSDYEFKEFTKKTDETRRRTYAVMRGSRKQMVFLSTSTSTISAISLAMAVVGVLIFKANLATVFLILNYTASITAQLFSFGNTSLRNYNRAFGDASDMTAILQVQPEVQDPIKPEKSRIKMGKIEFRAVDFKHEGAGDSLFTDLNLVVEPGQKVGLVGHSGSGKTTFTRLLLRFSDIDGGEILIDKQNIAKLTQDDLRRSIAYVPQEPIMFHRSLSDNISYGEFGASQSRLIRVAKMAHADDFIKQLPEGYQTLVGERGVKLSGGQRQRIAIARAMLKNAPILVLDEATSALDSDSELLIQDALWKLMEKRTAIVIAHRLSTIQKMDRIVVLEDGKVVEDGSHKQLIKAGGVYAQLWSHQSGGFIDE